jgi:hypothetical protein
MLKYSIRYNTWAIVEFTDSARLIDIVLSLMTVAADD